MIQDKQEDAFISAMVDGSWRIDSYTEGATTITEQFKGYQFSFSEDGSVFGINDSETVKGTWKGDIQNYSISSNFPSASDPVKKLNGVWRITRTSEDFVQAEMTTLAGKVIMHLRKAR